MKARQDLKRGEKLVSKNQRQETTAARSQQLLEIYPLTQCPRIESMQLRSASPSSGLFVSAVGVSSRVVSDFTLFALVLRSIVVI